MADISDRTHEYGWRARLGVIVPPTNTVNEAEWQRMAPTGVSVHATRMPLHTDTETDAGERALYADLEQAVQDLSSAGMDVIAYGCTAGSMVRPLTRLTDYMTKLCNRPTVATAPAIVQALQALGASKVSVATPYHDVLNAHEKAFLAANGIETLAIAGLGIGAGGAHEYTQIARRPASDAFDLAVSVDRAEAEAIVISCTDFATLPIIDRLEQTLGKPVVTSNQATFWAALRASGITDHLDGAGRLLREH
ncbi:MAG: aspartate/glutamate racemase family protein [Alphaproteobacteria bacterium]|nr:aspartate/glutamate racemase family protein [Alphaproteobacteria bacterium]